MSPRCCESIGSGDTIDIWYSLQNRKGKVNWFAPLKQGGYAPEYVDHRGDSIVGPKAHEIKDLAQRDATKSRADVHIIVPAVDMQTGGKVPAKDLEAVDAYLRECIERGARKALLALNFPTDAEKIAQDDLRKGRKSRL